MALIKNRINIATYPGKPPLKELLESWLGGSGSDLRQNTLILPSRRLVRNARQILGKILMRNDLPQAILPPQIETFEGWVASLIPEKATGMINDIQEQILIWEILQSNADQFEAFKSRRGDIPLGVVSPLSQTLRELRFYRIDGESLVSAAKKHDFDGNLTLICEGLAKLELFYKQALTRKMLFDAISLEEAVLEEIGEGSLKINPRVCLAAFDSYTVLQQSIINAAAESSEINILLSYKALPENNPTYNLAEKLLDLWGGQRETSFSDKPDSVSDFIFWEAPLTLRKETGSSLANRQDLTLSVFNNPYEETLAISRQISAKLAADPDQKILVTFPNMDRYIGFVKDVFSAAGLPYNLSYGEKLEKFSSVNLALVLMEAGNENFDFDSLGRILTHPSLDLMGLEDRAAYLTLAEANGQLKGLESWTQALRNCSPQAQKRMAYFLKQIKGLEGRMTWSERRIKLAGILKSDFLKINEEAEHESLGELWGLWADIEAIRASEKDIAEDLDGHLSLLRFALQQKRFALKGDEKAPVQVMGLMESRGLKFDCVYLGGLISIDLPGELQPSIFLRERLLEQLGMNTSEQVLSGKKLDFVRIIDSPVCHLSYPRTVDSRIAEPSTFLLCLEEVLEEKGVRGKGQGIADCGMRNAECEAINESRYKRLLNPQSSALSTAANQPADQPTNQPTGFADKEAFSVSELEDYGKCPRFYYWRHLLRISPLALSEEERYYFELGRRVHAVMQEFMETHPRFVDHESDLYWESLRALGANHLSGGAWAPDYERLFRDQGIMRQYLEEEINWSVLCGGPTRLTEHSLSGQGGVRFTGKEGGFTLKARIDRIDETPHGLMIFDYKTGSIPTPGSVISLKSPQLPWYAAMLRESLHVPILGIGYIRLKGEAPFIKPLAYLADHQELFLPQGLGKSLSSVQFDDLLDNAVEQAAELVSLIRKGYFPLAKDSAVCKKCVYQARCKNAKDDD